MEDIVKKILSPDNTNSDHMSGSWFLLEIEKIFKNEIKKKFNALEILARNIQMNFYVKVPKNTQITLTIRIEEDVDCENTNEYKTLCTFLDKEKLSTLITSDIIIIKK